MLERQVRELVTTATHGRDDVPECRPVRVQPAEPQIDDAAATPATIAVALDHETQRAIARPTAPM
jgi:hypothetical protein